MSTISPGDVVIIRRNVVASMWRSNPFDTNAPSEFLVPLLLDRHQMLVIRSEREEHYAFVLLDGMLGYVNAGLLERVT